jgi:diguanylate cyclase (GGDEF)-like protein
MSNINESAIEGNWVADATRTARQAVTATLGLAALIVAALVFERAMFANAANSAVKDVKAALTAADNILLQDERLTMSAYLAAYSGEPRWIERYEAHIPLIDKAIKSAVAIAPPGAAQRFDQATRKANDALVEMERAAFVSISQGDLPKAKAILNGAEYSAQKRILSDGSGRFLEELQAAVDADLAALRKRSLMWTIAIALFAASVVAWFWFRLNGHLQRAERAFRAKQAEVANLALQDTLTGLANRRALHLELSKIIARAQREEREIAVLMIDLDGFKPVNDRHGHDVGDAVLQIVGERIAQNVRADEIAARYGGDEFSMALYDCDKNGSQRAGERVVKALSQPYALAQGEVTISASVGIAHFPTDATNIDELLRKADQALYAAKRAGGRCVHAFSATAAQTSEH